MNSGHNRLTKIELYEDLCCVEIVEYDCWREINTTLASCVLNCAVARRASSQSHIANAAKIL